MLLNEFVFHAERAAVSASDAKRPEDFGHAGFVLAAVVAHPNDDVAAFRVDAEPDHSAGLRVFGGVAQEIRDHLADAVRVATQSQAIGAEARVRRIDQGLRVDEAEQLYRSAQRVKAHPGRLVISEGTANSDVNMYWFPGTKIIGTYCPPFATCADEIVAKLTDMMPCGRLYFVVDTLEYLAKGGRIGGAKKLLAELLEIKPKELVTAMRKPDKERHAALLEQLKPFPTPKPLPLPTLAADRLSTCSPKRKPARISRPTTVSRDAASSPPTAPRRASR